MSKGILSTANIKGKTYFNSFANDEFPVVEQVSDTKQVGHGDGYVSDGIVPATSEIDELKLMGNTVKNLVPSEPTPTEEFTQYEESAFVQTSSDTNIKMGNGELKQALVEGNTYKNLANRLSNRTNEVTITSSGNLNTLLQEELDQYTEILEDEPFKNAIVEGRTLVNLTMNDNIKLSHSIDNTEGDSTCTFTINESTNRKLDVIINSAPTSWVFIETNIKLSMLKPNTKYLVKAKNITNIRAVQICGGNGENKLAIQVPFINNCAILETNNLSALNGRQVLYLITNNSFDSYPTKLSIEDLVLIEYQEGMENWDIPYFEGMKSVEYTGTAETPSTVLKTVGKNLLKIDTDLYTPNDNNGITFSYTQSGCILNGQSNGIGSPTTRMIDITDILKIGKTYTVSRVCNYDEVSVAIRIYKTDGSRLYKGTYTIIGDEEKIELYLQLPAASTTVYNNVEALVQIEEGSAATSYEPYKESLVTTTNTLALRNVNGVKDTLNLNTGVLTRRIGEVTLDGNKTVSSDGSLPYILTNDLVINNVSISDKLKNLDVNSLFIDDSEGICVQNRGTNSRIYIKINGITTAAELKEYLTTNPIKVQYLLANPITENISLTSNKCLVYGQTQSDTAVLPDFRYSLPTSKYEILELKANTYYTVKTNEESFNLNNYITTGYTQPVITESDSSSFKVKTDVEDTTVAIEDNKPAKEFKLEGQTFQNILPEPTSLVMSTDLENTSINDQLTSGVKMVDCIAPIAKLEGRTLVNVIDEPSGNSMTILDLDADIDAQYTTIDNTVQGGIHGAILKGQTLVNLYKITQSTPYTYGNGSYPMGKLSINLLANKTYLILLDFSTVDKDGKEVIDFFPMSTFTDGTLKQESNFNIKQSGKFTYKYTPTKDVKEYGLIIGQNNFVSWNPTVVLETAMIMEYQEGMENWDIPYFEGMQSVKMPILTTIGKNLFSGKVIENKAIDFVVGDVYDSPGYNAVDSYTPVLPNDYIVISNERGRLESNTVIFYNLNKEYVDFVNVNGGTVIPENVYYIKVYGLSHILNGNIQIEKGLSVTPYEPYKSNILTVNEEVELRKVGDVQDELDLETGKLTQRVGEKITLDYNNYSMEVKDSSLDNYVIFGIKYFTDNHSTYQNNRNCIVNNFKYMKWSDYLSAQDLNKEFVSLSSGGTLVVSLLKSRLVSINLDGFKQWLSQNPITVQYELATPTIKTVDLTIQDQDNNPIKSIQTQPTLTHITTSSNGLIPFVSIPSQLKYPTLLIKPSTQYTVQLKRPTVNNSNPLIVNLGGTELTAPSTSFTITTPNTLTTQEVLFTGKNNVIGEITITEGDNTSVDIPYFEGMKSVEAPSVKTVGINLFNIFNYFSASESVITEINNSKVVFSSSNAWDGVTFKWMKLKPNTTYTFSATKNNSSIKCFYRLLLEDGSTGSGEGGSTYYTFNTNSTGMVKFSFEDSVGNKTDNTVTDISLYEGNITNPTYEPYKENTISTPEDFVLRGVNGTKDSLDLNTGKVIRRIGEVVLDGSDDETWTLINTENTSEYNNTYCWRLTLAKNAIPHAYNDNAVSTICDKLNWGVYADGINEDYEHYRTNGAASGPASYIYIWLNQSKATNTDELKTYLAANPITIQYVLETPTTETVDLTYSGNYEILTFSGATQNEWTLQAKDDYMQTAEGYSVFRNYTLLKYSGNEIPILSPDFSFSGFDGGIGTRRSFRSSTKEESISNGGGYANIYLKIKNDRLSTPDVAGLQAYLAEHNLDIIYLNGTVNTNSSNKYPLLFANGHITSSSNTILPTVIYQTETKNSFIMNLMSASTQYTMKAFIADNAKKFTIDGTEISLTTNGTFTTPSTLTNKFLIMDSKEPMILKGDMSTKEIPYFKGIRSSFEGNSNIEIKTTGKNLWDNKILKDYSCITINKDDSITINGYLSHHYIFNYTLNKGNYIARVISNDEKIGYLHLFWGGGDEFLDTQGNAKTISKKTMLTGYLASGTYNNVNIKIQIEMVNSITPYEPYKSTTTTLNITEPLRSLPNGARDKVIFKDGVAKLVRHVGKVVLNGSEGWLINTGYIHSDIIEFTTYNGLYNASISINEKFINEGENTERLVGLNDGSFYLRINKNRLDSLDESGIQKYLQNNPITVYCAYKTPNIIPLFISDLPHLFKNGHVFTNTDTPAKITYKPYTLRTVKVSSGSPLNTNVFYSKDPNITVIEGSVENYKLPQFDGLLSANLKGVNNCALSEVYTLRSLPDGTRDTFNALTGVITRNITEIVMNGGTTGNRKASGISSSHPDNGITFWVNNLNIDSNRGSTDRYVLSDYGLDSAFISTTTGAVIDRLTISTGTDTNGTLRFAVPNSMGITTAEAFNEWLTEHPITVLCKANDVSYISISDILKPQASPNGTIYLDTTDNSINPVFKYRMPTTNFYQLDMKDNTTYTVQAQGTYTLNGSTTNVSGSTTINSSSTVIDL